jgi:hypothetical protein
VGGFGVALVWLWYGFGMALVWLWYGFGMALVWLWVGYQLALGGFSMALVWLCVALCGFADRWLRLLHSALCLLPLSECGFGVALRWLWVPNRLPTACLANGFGLALKWLRAGFGRSSANLEKLPSARLL